MENRYLEKIAFLDKIIDFYDNVSGAKHNHYKGLHSAMETIKANGYTLKGLERKSKLARLAKIKARLQAGGAAAATSVGGLYAFKKYNDHQINNFRKHADE